MKAFVLAALFGVAAALHAPAVRAQAPVVTPVGDPSVDADTIYSLRVDPARHPEEDAAILLDDGILVQQADGTGTRTYRMVAQVLDRDGVEQWAEHTFGYDGERESFRLNWAKVIGPDGSVISSEPAHQQVLDAPVPEQSPVFSDQKEVRVSLGGVEPGTIVDFSYTITTKKPPRPGDFSSAWQITTGRTTRRSRFVVDVPEGYDLQVVSTPATPKPVVTQGHGRTVYRWTEHDLKWVRPERFADVAHSDYAERIGVGAPGTWADVGAWYAGLARDRYALTDSVTEAAAKVVGDRTGVDALKALHKWVAQDFRYVSIALGSGSYQPRTPAEVLATRSGDCKDKATLFIALARKYGFESDPVLLNARGGVEERLPSIQQLDHEIAAVKIDGKWTYLDLTAATVPFGVIPPSYQGEFGLIVHDDGSVEKITFPESGPGDNASRIAVTGEILKDGSFQGHYRELHTGSLQYQLRSIFSRSVTRRQLDLFADKAAGNVIAGATGSNPKVFDGLDLDAPAQVSLDLQATRGTRPNVGGGRIFTLPIKDFANPELVTELKKERGHRRFPIDVEAVFGRATLESELHVTLPEGWSAKLPPDVSAKSRFGSYEARYEQKGRELSVVRKISGGSGTAPADALDELIGWLQKINGDDVPFLLLQTSGTPAAQ